ncbi:MAG: hypothetical protein MUQ30_06535 [Anaerolineae bacterium]|nr:hypothetical protein [Anaerolineae bacterium]
MAKTETAETKETTTKRSISHRVSWLLWGGLAALVILLVSAFSHAWETNQALKAELATLEPMLTAAQMEQDALLAQMAYVQSDEYVEDWSKIRAKMALPGDVLIVSVSVTPSPTVSVPVAGTPTPEPTAEPFWSALWHRIVGD